MFSRIIKNSCAIEETASKLRETWTVVTCLSSNSNEWYFNIDDKQYTGMAFIHFEKVFDTMDHDILANKLFLYGVRDMELRWFNSYLNDMLFKVIGISSNCNMLNVVYPRGLV